MRRDNDNGKVFARRAVVLGGAQLAGLAALAGRMYYLQVVEAERYATLAEENRISLRLLTPPRGRIVDRGGVPVAVSRQNWRAVIIAEQSADVSSTLDALGSIISLTETERRRIQRDLANRRSFVPVTVRESLEWQDVAKIEVNAHDLPGVSIEMGQSRYYPMAEKAAHILGYVGAVAEAELTGEPLLTLPGFRIGKNGVEKQYDNSLRGAAGSSQVEVNAVGRVIRELGRSEGQTGQEVVLTIDAGLQQFAHDRMGEEAGAVVVIDVNNGDILSLVSTPSYDPNAFVDGISGRLWRELNGNSRRPLSNKAISGQYAPGSTFKIAVMTAAIDAGIPTSHTVSCHGFVEMGNAKFHCWKKGGHGAVSMIDGMKLSCDVYFYDLARRLGIDKIAEVANKLGLGHALGLDLPAERPGLIPTRNWKLAVTGVPWQQGENLVAGIGQGFVLTTPLQLAVMTARIANGGQAITPRLVRPRTRAGGFAELPQAPSADLPKEAIAAVARGMYAVVNEARGGTAYRSRLGIQGVEMAGKTGTAQVRRITAAERLTGVRKNEDLPWEQRDHALFVCFAPTDNPRYAVAVVVEHGGGGAAVAAPIARDVMIETLKRDPARIRPGQRMAAAEPDTARRN